jgi:DNA-binding TFAR19-related protein (PDSD5 family)
MDDAELEKLRKRRLIQLRKQLKSTQEKNDDKKQDLLAEVFVGRAWEVFGATKLQYPQVAKRVREVIVQLVAMGKIKKVNGGELYNLLKKMGVRVKLKTRIQIKEHGKSKTFGEKMKE